MKPFLRYKPGFSGYLFLLSGNIFLSGVKTSLPSEEIFKDSYYMYSDGRIEEMSTEKTCFFFTVRKNPKFVSYKNCTKFPAIHRGCWEMLALPEN
jgi:hypothetical protein